MARRPALSREAAEAAATAVYGQRGTSSATLTITSDNRGPIRAWLTACGVSSDTARAASLATLKAAWTEDDNGTLARLLNTTTTKEPAVTTSSLGLTIAQRGERTMPAWQQQATEAAATVSVPVATPAQAKDAAAHLAHFMEAMLAGQKAPAMDAEAVRAIVAEEVTAALTNADRPRAVAITIADKPPVTLPAIRHHLVEACITIAANNVPLCLVGPAGSGKTTACEQVATALGLPFRMDGAPSGSHVYLGFIDAHGAYHSTPFRDAFENGGLYLADELDGATDPAAPLTLNAALANGHMTFPDSTEPVKRHADFRMVAACNTYGTGADRIYVGRTQLDGATLDRFAFLEFPYDVALERGLCANAEWLSYVHRTRATVQRLSLRHVVSTRAAMMGATLLAAGMDRAQVEAVALWKGLPAADIARVKGAL